MALFVLPPAASIYYPKDEVCCFPVEESTFAPRPLDEDEECWLLLLAWPLDDLELLLLLPLLP